MKKLFNDNAKTIAIMALIACAVMGYMLYNKSRKSKTSLRYPKQPVVDSNAVAVPATTKVD